jgi:Mlc titration factor MtfA (ptsG expression regulator)
MTEIYTEAYTLLEKLIEGNQLSISEKAKAQIFIAKLEMFKKEKELLLELDEILMYFEDFVHGEEGNDITYLRHKIFGILY